jgi:chromosome segregation ATPase
MSARLEVEEVVRFLRRFSDLMSTGHNSDHLSRAANLIETLESRIEDAEKLLHAGQLKVEANLELCQSTQINCAGLEKKLVEVQTELAERQRALNQAIVNAATKERQLLDQIEQGELRLAASESELTEMRSRLGTLGYTHALIPISTLRHAEAQFDAVAHSAGDIISRVMCVVGASTLGGAILESAALRADKAPKQAA